MGQSLNVVGMLRTPQLRAALAEVCTDMNGTRFDLRVVPLAQVAADPALPACDLIMVEVDPKDAAEMELLRGLVEHQRSEEHTSELQSLMRNSYAVFCLK